MDGMGGLENAFHDKIDGLGALFLASEGQRELTAFGELRHRGSLAVISRISGNRLRNGRRAES